MNVIEVLELTKRYKKGVIAVDSASFTVEQGAAFGLLGPIGSGKSSIIHMLLNFTKPTAGSIKLFDRDIATDFHEVQSKIGYPERPGFYGNFSAERISEFLPTFTAFLESMMKESRNFLF
jgi:ABC-type multidrug transport system, ATPase component